MTIPGHPERRERDLQELFHKAKKPVVLFVDDAHDLHAKHPEGAEATDRAGARMAGASWRSS